MSSACYSATQIVGTYQGGITSLPLSPFCPKSMANYPTTYIEMSPATATNTVEVNMAKEDDGQESTFTSLLKITHRRASPGPLHLSLSAKPSSASMALRAVPRSSSRIMSQCPSHRMKNSVSVKYFTRCTSPAGVKRKSPSTRS